MIRAATDVRTRLHPWQRDAAMIAGEQIPDPYTGELVHAYSTVVLAVPRRAGKSLMVLLELLAMMRRLELGRGWYSAQARSDAALILKDEWLPLIHGPRSRITGALDARLANGSEALEWHGTGSNARLFAPTRAGLHGTAGDLIVFDEAWAHSLERGRELQAAAQPLMATRPGAQKWIVSAAGDADSTWWIDWVDAGRAAARADTGRGICHLEWSADYPGADLANPATWIATHPAVRHAGHPHGTIPLEFLEAEYATDPALFARLYLNITDRLTLTTSPIDWDTWHALAVEPPARTGMLSIGVDSAPDQTATAVVACLDGDVLEVVAHRPGWAWVPDVITDLYDRHTVTAVGLDAAAPAGVLLQPLTAAGLPVVDCQLKTVTAAAGQMVEAVRTAGVRHVPHPSLDAAVIAARRRPIGDGAWAWGRMNTDTDVSPLVAAGLARHLHPAQTGQAPGIH